MVKKLISVFNNILKESDYKLITDNYFLKIGKYILVNEDETYECYNVEKNENISDTLNKIKILDFFSGMLNTNALLDLPGRKILSTNAYTFWIKARSLNLDLKDNIEKYYNNILRFNINNNEDVSRAKTWIYKNLNQICCNEINDLNYIKVFFIKEDYERCKEEYYKSFYKYISSKMWTQFSDENRDKGTINFNYTINYDKNLLISKLRAKEEFPYILSKKEAIDFSIFNKFISAINTNKLWFDIEEKRIELGSLKTYINGIYIEWKVENGNAVILNIEQCNEKIYLDKFKIIPFVIVPIKQLSRYNYLEYGYVNSIYALKAIVSDKFKSENEKSVINAKEKLFKIIDNLQLYKKKSCNFYNLLEQIIINGVLYTEEVILQKERFNIVLSIIYYLNDKGEEEVMNLQDKIVGVLDNEDIQTDDEYYYAIGQLASYLIYRKVGKKGGKELRSLLVCKTNKELMEQVVDLHIRFGYQLSLFYENSFNKLFVKTSIYTPHNKNIDKVMLLTGALDNNVLYKRLNNVIDSNYEQLGDERSLGKEEEVF